MFRKRRSRVRTLQHAIESELRDFSSPPMLFALLVEMKLRKSRVRLSDDERKRLQHASKTFLATGDSAVLSGAVNRKRKIRISISPKDLSQFEKIFTKTIDTTVTKTIAKLDALISVAPS